MRTSIVLLPLSSESVTENEFSPMVFEATLHVLPLSTLTSTTSPILVTALKVPVIVCSATLVTKSVVLDPRSIEIETVEKTESATAPTFATSAI